MSGTDALDVVVVDDHLLVREGIKAVLARASGITVVGEGEAGNHVLELVNQHRPDVLILDIGMPADAGDPRGPRFDAERAVRAIATQYPETAVLVVSQNTHRPIILGLVSSGIRGYILKDDALSAHLVEAVHIVAKGGVFLSREIEAEHLMKDSVLTDRHIELIQAYLASPNADRKEIALKLSISEHTVRNHMVEIRERLHVETWLAAVLKAVVEGYVALPRQL